VNGGSIADKVAFAKELLEKDVPVDSVFSKDEVRDTTPSSLTCPCSHGTFFRKGSPALLLLPSFSH
jgi:hypothetical protein